MRVYQNKFLPYKAEQLLLAGFDTPSYPHYSYVSDLSCDCAAGMPHLLQKTEYHEILVKTDKLFRFG